METTEIKEFKRVVLENETKRERITKHLKAAEAIASAVEALYWKIPNELSDSITFESLCSLIEAEDKEHTLNKLFRDALINLTPAPAGIASASWRGLLEIPKHFTDFAFEVKQAGFSINVSRGEKDKRDSNGTFPYQSGFDFLQFEKGKVKVTAEARQYITDRNTYYLENEKEVRVIELLDTIEASMKEFETLTKRTTGKYILAPGGGVRMRRRAAIEVMRNPQIV